VVMMVVSSGCHPTILHCSCLIFLNKFKKSKEKGSRGLQFKRWVWCGKLP
jgi:hypothetical protein